MPCREHLAQLRGRQGELDRLDAAVLAVSFETPAQVSRMAPLLRLPYPVLSDPERRAYAAFGLPRSDTGRLWNLPTIGAYVRGLARGRTPPMPRGDLHQMGGDFVLDHEGGIVLAHRSAFPADRPAIDDILAALRGAAPR